MVDCSFVKQPIEKHLRGVGSAGERRMRLRWQQWLLLEDSELSSEELAGGETNECLKFRIMLLLLSLSKVVLSPNKYNKC